MSSHADQEQNKEASRWFKDFSDFYENFYITPDLGYRLVTACMKVGYDPNVHGNLYHWLFHPLGVMLQEGKFESD